MITFEPQERRLDKYRRRYLSAADELQQSVAAGAMLAAVAVIQADTDAAEHALRKELAAESVARKIIDGSGNLLHSVAVRALAYPAAPDSFEMAVYSVACLVLTAYQARVGSLS